MCQCDEKQLLLKFIYGKILCDEYYCNRGYTKNDLSQCMLSAQSLSTTNGLFPKRKKRGNDYDMSYAANFFGGDQTTLTSKTFSG